MGSLGVDDVVCYFTVHAFSALSRHGFLRSFGRLSLALFAIMRVARVANVAHALVI